MILSYSPLRITFGGGGTDIEPFVSKYGGAVVNATIDRGVTVRYIDDGYQTELSSRDFVKSYIINMHGPSTVSSRMLDYLLRSGLRTGRIIMSGDVPPGSGLGSSSAAMSALVNLTSIIRKTKYNWESIARESYNIEKNYFHIVLGLQDPYAIALGGFKFMEFNGDGVKYEMLDKYGDFTSELEKRIILIYTGHTRQSSEVLIDQVRAATQGDQETTEKLLQLKEVAFRLRKAVIDNDYSEFDQAINYGWEIKKTLGQKTTNRRVDTIIESALKNGASAARLMGGGSQGFILVLSRPGKINELQRAMMNASNFVVRTSFDKRGTRRLFIR